MEKAHPNGEDKERFVLNVFETIADVYDPMNRILTLGLWGRWQRRFFRHLPVGRDQQWLDVASGTGDLALMLALRVGEGGNVVGIDLSPSMLAHARRKAQEARISDRVKFVEGNALALPLPDRQFDGATIGFALRNVRDIDGTLREMRRVVRPGGIVASLEVSKPDFRPVRALFGAYYYHIAPWLGRFAGKGSEPYAWLAESLRRFPDRHALEQRFKDAGLVHVRSIPLTLGAAAIHLGEVPTSAR